MGALSEEGERGELGEDRGEGRVVGIRRSTAVRHLCSTHNNSKYSGNINSVQYS